MPTAREEEEAEEAEVEVSAEHSGAITRGVL